MTDYLQEAAALLSKAAATNESKYAAQYAAQTLIEGRERIAMKFAQLASIERGIIPTEMVGELLTQIIRTELRQ